VRRVCPVPLAGRAGRWRAAVPEDGEPIPVKQAGRPKDRTPGEPPRGRKWAGARRGMKRAGPGRAKPVGWPKDRKQAASPMDTSRAGWRTDTKPAGWPDESASARPKNGKWAGPGWDTTAQWLDKALHRRMGRKPAGRWDPDMPEAAWPKDTKQGAADKTMGRTRAASPMGRRPEACPRDSRTAQWPTDIRPGVSRTDRTPDGSRMRTCCAAGPMVANSVDSWSSDGRDSRSLDAGRSCGCRRKPVVPTPESGAGCPAKCRDNSAGRPAREDSLPPANPSLTWRNARSSTDPPGSRKERVGLPAGEADPATRNRRPEPKDAGCWQAFPKMAAEGRSLARSRRPLSGQPKSAVGLRCQSSQYPATVSL
jgi:hypothetical protein